MDNHYFPTAFVPDARVLSCSAVHCTEMCFVSENLSACKYLLLQSLVSLNLCFYPQLTFNRFSKSFELIVLFSQNFGHFL